MKEGASSGGLPSQLSLADMEDEAVVRLAELVNEENAGFIEQDEVGLEMAIESAGWRLDGNRRELHLLLLERLSLVEEMQRMEGRLGRLRAAQVGGDMDAA